MISTIMHTVHDALAHASQETPAHNKMPFEVGSFKCEPITKQIASEICDRHGTSLSAFLRNCTRLLVADYIPKGNELLPTGAPNKEG